MRRWTSKEINLARMQISSDFRIPTCRQERRLQSHTRKLSLSSLVGSVPMWIWENKSVVTNRYGNIITSQNPHNLMWYAMINFEPWCDWIDLKPMLVCEFKGLWRTTWRRTNNCLGIALHAKRTCCTCYKNGYKQILLHSGISVLHIHHGP